MSIAEPIISATTVWSLAATVALLAAAYGLSIAVLPRTISKKERGIYIWHIFDALTHLTLEASFCYYSLFSSAPFPAENTVTLFGNSAVSYGVKYSSAPLAKLWQEYARADLRWGNSDVTTLCIELITVVLAGPLALWVAEMIRKGEGRRWFWMAILATAEIYGGWMTFAPEWFSGNQNLVTDNFMYKWVYLAFFNGLWVVIPVWLLIEAYFEMVPAVEMMDEFKKREAKRKAL
ncbi:Emopamil-binding protein [Pyronema domesticum]|nr:Emopamil-binding protein [Pyronema domesticum]